MLKIYFAGPDVFEVNAIELGRRYVKLAAAHGFKGYFPLDNKVDLTLSNADQIIFENNKILIENCDIVIANLNDFRGTEPDSGTVWEVAYALGIKKRVIGYTKSSKTIVERVKDAYPVIERDGSYYDHNNIMVENFQNQLNLMLQKSIDYLVIGDVEAAIKRAEVFKNHY